jgi:hypothetical protein
MIILHSCVPGADANAGRMRIDDFISVIAGDRKKDFMAKRKPGTGSLARAIFVVVYIT